VAVQVQEEEKKETLEKMKERVDRLMKAVYNEIVNGDLRIELITRLVEIRRLLNGGGEEVSN